MLTSSCNYYCTCWTKNLYCILEVSHLPEKATKNETLAKRARMKSDRINATSCSTINQIMLMSGKFLRIDASYSARLPDKRNFHPRCNYHFSCTTY